MRVLVRADKIKAHSFVDNKNSFSITLLHASVSLSLTNHYTLKKSSLF